jgi:hypothetical protein
MRQLEMPFALDKTFTRQGKGAPAVIVLSHFGPTDCPI